MDGSCRHQAIRSGLVEEGTCHLRTYLQDVRVCRTDMEEGLERQVASEFRPFARLSSFSWCRCTLRMAL